MTVCVGQKVTLSGAGGNTIRWSPSIGLNANEGSRVVAGPTISTIYTVEVSQGGYCAVTKTVEVLVFPRPNVIAGNDTSYNVNEAIFVSALSSDPVRWTSGEGISCRNCAVTQVYPSRSGCYVVEVTNEYGCTASDQVCLEIREDFSIYVPNSFTPNGDGLNDVFLVFGENISNVNLEIFDRWGELLFVSYDQFRGWDGTFKGEKCKPDAYTYRLRYQGLDRKTYERTGHVQIVR
jgi:gliding motility-associated-like protein